MFTQSWSNILLFILLWSTGYYFFRCQLKKNCGDRIQVSDIRDPDPNTAPFFRNKNKGSVDEAEENRLDKKVVMSALHLLIDKYPGIEDPLLQKSVHDFIIRESTSSSCLNDEELSELWS